MILQYKGKSLFPSKLIAWFTWSLKKYSYSAWSFCEADGDQLVGDVSEYEAWAGVGTTHVPAIGLNHTPGTRIDLYELKKPLTNKEASKMLAFFHETLNEPYDYKGILGFLIRYKTNNPDAWFCSEWIFTALEKIARCLLQDVYAYQVGPAMMAMSNDITYVGYIIVGEGYKIRQDAEED